MSSLCGRLRSKGAGGAIRGTRTGYADVRRTLYRATLTGVHQNIVLKAHDKQLLANRRKKVTLVAYMLRKHADHSMPSQCHRPTRFELESDASSCLTAKTVDLSINLSLAALWLDLNFVNIID